MAKEITLLRGEIALVDDDDYDWLNQWIWYTSNGYVVRRDYDSTGKLITVFIHRAITGAEKGQIVDHINGSKLDNRKENLRICTHAENMRNRRNKKHGSSKFKGVSWQENMNLWEASITYENKHMSLGYFQDEIIAANMYNHIASKLFGEFAYLNNVPFISEQECNDSKYMPKTYSKYRGVTWSRRSNKWKAGIEKSSKAIHLGYFINEIDAAQAYNTKAVELFGNKAKLNIIETGD